MLIHQHDGPPDDQAWQRFAIAQGFGHLVAAGRNRDLPVVVPTQFVLGTSDGSAEAPSEPNELVLHLAKPNPVWSAIDENPKVLLSIAGDWAYIPSAWKAIGDEDPSMMVPTTYYAAVQIIGTARVLDALDDVAAVLRQQLKHLEPGSAIADPIKQTNMLRVIRGIRISIEEVRAKFKFGGNVDDEHREAIADRLADRAGPGDTAAATHIPESSQS